MAEIRMGQDLNANGTRAAASGIQPWHTLTPSQVAEILGTSVHGLGTAEVAARLSRHGANALNEAPPPSPLLILLHQFQSPLIYILLAAAVVTLALEEFIDAGVIGAVLLLNAAIGFTQEYRAEHSVRALMRLVSPKARVIRGGREREIESRDLVPGDLVLLETGVRVPADLRLISATALMIDESLLTGESVPVTKTTSVLAAPHLAVGDRLNMAYAESIVTHGRGRGYVTATGAETELGAIAAHIRTRERAETPLRRRMSRFAAVIGIACAAGSIGVFALGLMRGESIADMFMVAVAMAVAVVPEGLPVVFTITLALAAAGLGIEISAVRSAYAVEAEMPFEPERQFSASFRARDERHYLFVRGAPERVLAMSDKILLDDSPAPIDRAAVLSAAQALASEGLRVLGMAYRVLPHPSAAVEEPKEPEALTFLDLQGSMDPPRPPSEGIVSALLWERTPEAGLVIAIGTLALFRWELGSSADIGKAQTAALTTMVVFQLFHVGNCRSESRSVFVISPLSNRFLLGKYRRGTWVDCLVCPTRESMS